MDRPGCCRWKGVIWCKTSRQKGSGRKVAELIVLLRAVAPEIRQRQKAELRSSKHARHRRQRQKRWPS